MNMRNVWKPAELSMLVVFSTLVIVNFSDEVAATNRYVGGGGSPNYATISLALAASSSGDTIYVAYGSYSDNVAITISINIIGVMSSGNRPSISAVSANYPVFDITVNNIVVKIENFEIVGSNNNYGIRSSDDPNQEAGVEIDNCVIHGFQSSGAGIKLHSGANFHWIHDCVIYDNGDGIYMDTGNSQVGNENCMVEDNEIYDNADEGIYNDGDYNWFSDNVIHDNGDKGIELYYSDDVWIATSYYGPTICEIYENDYGIYATYSDDLTIIGSSDDDLNYQVEIYDNTNSGIYAYYCDGMQVSYTSTWGNTHGMDFYNCTNGIMDHLVVTDDIFLYNCDYWAISLSTISYVYQDPDCSNIVIT